MKAELVIDAKAQIGEGAIWNHKEQRLWWVDIEGKKLHVFDPVLDNQKSIAFNERIGTVVPVEGGGALVAFQNGIHFLDFDSEEITFLVNPLSENIRFNDGKCDPSGRFWVGSLALDQKANVSSLYRFDPDGSIRTMIDGVTNSNGIVWSTDKKRMYYIDTPTRKVTAYNYNDETGNISNPAITVAVEGGSPDGMTIDEEGMVWIAIWSGAAVARYNPETGALLERIDIPAKNVTSCAFGGKDLDILFITSAYIGMDDHDNKSYPLAGGVFAVMPGVKGIPASFFRKKV